MRGVEFKWRTEEYPDKSFDEGKKIGLIAQEVEKVLPEAVRTDKEGYKSVEYADIVGVLVEAVKDLKKLNEALKAQDEELKRQNEELRTRIEALESRLVN